MDLQPAQKITYQNKYDVCGKCVSRGETMLMAAGILSLLFALPFFFGHTRLDVQRPDLAECSLYRWPVPAADGQ